MQRNPKKSTANNRIGEIDLRVVRDNVEELTSKCNKRLTPDSSGSGATYAANKCARAMKRLEQMQTDLDDATATKPACAGEMMQYLVFMREEADRRSAEDDRRRREDREAIQEADELEWDERETVRRNKVAAAEVRRCREMELAGQTSLKITPLTPQPKKFTKEWFGGKGKLIFTCYQKYRAALIRGTSTQLLF
jgi:hypothetical protein